MIITLGGKCGAGKWTLAKKLAEKLWFTIIGIGDIKRDLAKQMWLTIAQRDEIGWKDPTKAHEFDLKFEDYQKSLSLEDNIILDWRMAFWCQPKAFKIFLDVSDEEWAQRVFQAQRDSDARHSLEEVLETNKKRNFWHAETYKKLYGVDIFDLSQYDLVIDTTELAPDEIYERVLQTFEVFIQAK